MIDIVTLTLTLMLVNVVWRLFCYLFNCASANESRTHQQSFKVVPNLSLWQLAKGMKRPCASNVSTSSVGASPIWNNESCWSFCRRVHNFARSSLTYEALPKMQTTAFILKVKNRYKKTQSNQSIENERVGIVQRSVFRIVIETSNLLIWCDNWR